MGKPANLVLWGVGTSRTIRAHWAMQELGLAYETRPIGPRTGETKTAEYTALNPRQKIPLLQDGDFTIGESAAIVADLSRTYSTPENALIPEPRRQYAAWLEWCFFIVAELDSTSLYVMRRPGPMHSVTSMASRPRWSPMRRSISAGNYGIWTWPSRMAAGF